MVKKAVPDAFFTMHFYAAEEKVKIGEYHFCAIVYVA